jgi:hypothetical protein
MPRGSELDLNTRGWERWVPNFNSITSSCVQSFLGNVPFNFSSFSGNVFVTANRFPFQSWNPFGFDHR